MTELCWTTDRQHLLSDWSNLVGSVQQPMSSVIAFTCLSNEKWGLPSFLQIWNKKLLVGSQAARQLRWNLWRT